MEGLTLSRHADRIRFVFDPICPWCWQTSRWVRRLEALGEVEVSWGLFSLEAANSDDDAARWSLPVAGQALRTAVLVREREGNDALGRFYEALGTRRHHDGAALADPDVIEAALEEAGLDPALRDKAMGDESTLDTLRAEHDDLVARTRSFGVPTIVLDDGAGPAIFGPVITGPPAEDATAVELWRHVSWLTRHEAFSELKRDRTSDPDLESFRQFQRRKAA